MTLAAANTLLLYEVRRIAILITLLFPKLSDLAQVFEFSSHSLGAWNAHLSGITHMMVLRGPELHRSPISQATVEDHRYTAVRDST